MRFTLPRDVYHGKGALEALKSFKGKKAMIVVGGGSMKRFGFLQKAEAYLKEAGMEVELFENVEPDPSVETVMKGADAMLKFQPDWIVAMGGGSPIDAAKAMWIKYEYPDCTFEDMCKVFGIPELRKKAHFCAISSTSGTATEVTAFSIITDYHKGIKYPIADFEITPDVAIVDPDLAETMPFFADRRLIVIENSGFFKNASPELADYIKTMPDTACFLFVENEADKRGKMYKAVKSKGRVVEMARQDEKTLLYWVAGNVKKEGYKIKEQTARYLLSTTGTDMENLEKELEKLFCYCMGKEEIEVRDIEAICTTQITNKIFEMVEAVAVRNQKKALDYYYDLLALKEPPMRILYLLTRQFKLLLEVKDLAGKRYDKAAIAKTVGLHPFVAGKYMQQCRTFEKKELRSILEDAVDTEELVKTGRLNDVMSVELFIVKYSAA